MEPVIIININQLDDYIDLGNNLLVGFIALILPIVLLAIEIIGKDFTYLLKLFYKDNSVGVIIFFALTSIGLSYILSFFENTYYKNVKLFLYHSLGLLWVIIFLIINLMFIINKFIYIYNSNYQKKLLTEDLSKSLKNFIDNEDSFYRGFNDCKKILFQKIIDKPNQKEILFWFEDYYEFLNRYLILDIGNHWIFYREEIKEFLDQLLNSKLSINSKLKIFHIFINKLKDIIEKQENNNHDLLYISELLGIVSWKIMKLQNDDCNDYWIILSEIFNKFYKCHIEKTLYSLFKSSKEIKDNSEIQLIQDNFSHLFVGIDLNFINLFLDEIDFNKKYFSFIFLISLNPFLYKRFLHSKSSKYIKSILIKNKKVLIDELINYKFETYQKFGMTEDIYNRFKNSFLNKSIDTKAKITNRF